VTVVARQTAHTSLPPPESRIARAKPALEVADLSLEAM
jgi:hypothetical protein